MAATLLLSVQNAGVSFANKKLFEDLSFNIQEGERISLVGKNGTGKTTLMNVITGDKELDEGTRWQMQGTTIGYLQQEITPQPGQTVYDFIFAELKAENQNESNAYKIDMVVAPLDLRVDELMTNLSGGQLRRAALARALVEEPDILLLDEPTNHLDLDVIEWLEEFLKSWRGALVCISHDKAFLTNVSNRIFWLDRGKLRVCPRGFENFDDWSQGILENEEKELQSRQKALEHEMEWASRGVKARRKRNIRRLELMKEEREKLRRDKGAFMRMMAKIEMPPLDENNPSSKIVAEFYKVHKNFGDKTILDGFSFRVLRGDRIGILGKNGSGKTSFLRMLIGELDPDQGTVKRARNLDLSYFDQKRRDLIPEYSLWRTLCADGDHVNVRGKPRHVIGYLIDFMFESSQALQPVSTLSGGQKNRLMLAKILANPGNFLILDEPTNDLDMDTLEMLEEILVEYKGTLFIVSHDRDFLDQTVTKILAFEGDGRVEGYIGGYSDYLEARRESQKPAKAVKAAPEKKDEEENPAAAVAKKEPAVKMSYKLQYELEKLPGKIETLTKEIEDLVRELSDSGFYARDPSGFQNKSRRLGEARDEMDVLETRWLELEEMKAASES